MIPVIVLAIVFVLIAVRQVGSVRLRIWQIMLGGAVLVLLTGQISPATALRAINADVMLFLFGVFLIGQAMEESGYLARLSSRLFGRARTAQGLVALILFGSGLLAAVLMNDTLACVGTPLVLALARRSRLSAKPLLLALAFAVTIGTVMSPIGNPQNLLIALGGGLSNPFVTFFRYLFVPTLLNLGLAWLMLRGFYRRELTAGLEAPAPEPLRDPRLAARLRRRSSSCSCSSSPR